MNTFGLTCQAQHGCRKRCAPRRYFNYDQIGGIIHLRVRASCCRLESSRGLLPPRTWRFPVERRGTGACAEHGRGLGTSGSSATSQANTRPGKRIIILHPALRCSELKRGTTSWKPFVQRTDAPRKARRGPGLPGIRKHVLHAIRRSKSLLRVWVSSVAEEHGWVTTYGQQQQRPNNSHVEPIRSSL